jgi:hypothetical protein
MTNPGFGFSTRDCGTDSKSFEKEKGPAVSAPGFFFPFP